MLSKSAFNALLKTLEEPPPHVKFIFATTEIRKVPVTILSRCQRFDLKRMEVATLMQLYGKVAAAESVTVEDEALRLIARAAEGSARDGLSLLDQAIAFGDGHVKTNDVMSMLGLVDRAHALDLFEAVMAGEPGKALALAEGQFSVGTDPVTLLADIADFTHYVTRLKLVSQSATADAARTETEKQRGTDFAKRLSMPHLTRAWQMLLKGIAETQTAAQPEKAAEMVLIRLAHTAGLPQGEELVKLAQKASAGGARAAGPVAKVEDLRREVAEPDAPPVSGNLAVAPREATTDTVPTMRAFTSFADIVGLAHEKRDLKFKSDLERNVRPISVEPGKFKLALEKGASPALVNEIKRKLDAWTGRSWGVMLQADGGASPLHSQKLSAIEELRAKAMADADVQAILAAFPNAEVKVNLPQDFALPSPNENLEEMSHEESD
jgi:DNA polymerase III subunit gamma/tau